MDKHREFNLLFSLTNVYNRNNIFYVDRINRKRVDQLPILPAFAAITASNQRKNSVVVQGYSLLLRMP